MAGAVNAKSNPLEELQTMIRGTIEAYPNINDRVKALKAIQWRLRGPNGEYIGLNKQLACSFVPESAALVFDGRDNEEMKLRAYEAALGPLTVEILPQAK